MRRLHGAVTLRVVRGVSGGGRRRGGRDSRGRGPGGRRTLAKPAVLALALLAACTAGSSDTTVPAERLPSLVLQPADLAVAGDASAYTRFEDAAVGAGPGQRFAESRAPGRTAGWRARYRRTDGAAKHGVLVVDSRVDLFRSPTQADLRMYAESESGGQGAASAERLPDPRLGDESVATTYQQAALASPVRYYAIAWRRGPLIASVVASGFEGGVTLDAVRELAGQVDRRLRAVLEARRG